MNAVSKIIRIILFPIIFICIALPSVSQIDEMNLHFGGNRHYYNL